MELSWSGHSRFTWIVGAPWTFHWGRGFCQKRQIFTGFYLNECLQPCLNRTHVLQKIGITAVLNTAEGPWSEWGFVDLSPSHYQGSGIHYQVDDCYQATDKWVLLFQGFCLWDSPGTTIEPYFGPAAEYLDLVLSAPGGKVAKYFKEIL